MRTGYLVIGSLAVHAAVFVAISARSKTLEKRQTLIAMVDQKKKEEEKKPEPPKPIEVPKEVLQPKSAPAPAPEAPPTPDMEALPDYGLHLQGGGGSGPGGMAIHDGDGGAPRATGPIEPQAPPVPVEKALGAAKPSSAAKDPDLAEEIAAWKPKPTARVKPVYPDEARASEIEGTVVVEAVVDCSGKVASARVVQGLGHGLDDAALTAIRKTEFEPAARCRERFQKSMKINYAFRLGD